MFLVVYADGELTDGIGIFGVHSTKEEAFAHADEAGPASCPRVFEIPPYPFDGRLARPLLDIYAERVEDEAPELVPFIQTFVDCHRYENSSIADLRLDMMTWHARHDDPFWSSKKKAWHRRVTKLLDMCHDELGDDNLVREIRHVLAETAPPPPENGNTTSTANDAFMEASEPR